MSYMDKVALYIHNYVRNYSHRHQSVFMYMQAVCHL